jgi:KaiC/GvpD/RAD55 family RecA-like ATPase
LVTEIPRSGRPGDAGTPDQLAQALVSRLKISEREAKQLVGAGFRTLDQIARAASYELASAGLDPKRADDIRKAAGIAGAAAQESAAKAAAPPASPAPAPGFPPAPSAPQSTSAPSGGKGKEGDSSDALKKWLSGEEDALKLWLSEGDEVVLTAPSQAAAPPPSEISTKEVEEARKQAEDLRDALKAQLEKVKSAGGVDPIQLIEENAQLNMHLQSEIRRRKESEQELETSKTNLGQAQKQAKELQAREGEDKVKSIQKELSLTLTKLRSMEESIKAKDSELESLRKDVLGKIDAKPKGEKELKQKEMELISREAKLKELTAQLELKEIEMREKLASAAASGGGATDEEMRKRLAAEIESKDKEWQQKESDYRKAIMGLEEEVKKLQIELKTKAEIAELAGKGGGAVEDVLKRKEGEVIEKEKSIHIREAEIARLKEELTDRQEELDKLREPIKFKEEELSRREQDLVHRENLLQAEKKKVSAIKQEVGGGGERELEMKRRLEDLEREISNKERLLKEKEKYLRAKEEELRKRSQGVIEAEIEAKEKELTTEFQQEKAKTGTGRLDDLMFGGVPFGAQVLVNGPNFSGKEVLVYSFVAEGLKKGVPAIVVLTDMTPAEFKDEMTFLLPAYEEYEQRGLVKYIDVYSPTMGDYAENPHATYVKSVDDTDGLTNAVDSAAKVFRDKYRIYRIAFKSVSSTVSHLDPKVVFKFLQPFLGRRKKDKAVGLYLLEKGMHTDSDVQMLGANMEGEIEIKIDQLKTFLRVKGVCDVQSRQFIEYSFTKSGVNLKSFSLGHIK